MRFTTCLAATAALVALSACRTTVVGPSSAPTPDGVSLPPTGLLVLDLGAREVTDLQVLVDGADPPYRRIETDSQWTLRAREGAVRPGPRTIQSVDSGTLSRLALLRVGELDAADLDEADLAALADTTAAPPALYRFPDYERIALRFGPGLSPPERRWLWESADAPGLVSVLFPRTGALALTCLPGRLASPPPTGSTARSPGPLAVLVAEGRPRLEDVALRVAAAWTAAGTPAFARPLPWPVLRDRLLAGRFDVVVLALDRDAVPPEEHLSRAVPRWSCDEPAALPEGPGAPEASLRSECGLYPLLSLDRVVAAGDGLDDLSFDERGRVRWDRVNSIRAESGP